MIWTNIDMLASAWSGFWIGIAVGMPIGIHIALKWLKHGKYL